MKLMKFETMWSDNLPVWCSYENFKEAEQKMVKNILSQGLGRFHYLESCKPKFTGKVIFTEPFEKQTRIIKALILKLKRKCGI